MPLSRSPHFVRRQEGVCRKATDRKANKKKLQKKKSSLRRGFTASATASASQALPRQRPASGRKIAAGGSLAGHMGLVSCFPYIGTVYGGTGREQKRGGRGAKGGGTDACETGAAPSPAGRRARRTRTRTADRADARPRHPARAPPAPRAAPVPSALLRGSRGPALSPLLVSCVYMCGCRS